MSRSQEVFLSDDIVEEANPLGLLRVEDSASEEDLLGERLTYEVREAPCRSGRGQDAESRLGVADLGGWCPDAEVARVGEFGAAQSGGRRPSYVTLTSWSRA